MFDSEYLKKAPGEAMLVMIDSLKSGQAQLLSNQAYPFVVTTGTDGTVTLDYTALKLTAVPVVAIVPKLSKDTDTPLFFNLIGTPTKTSAKLQVRKIASILATGLVPQYAGVAGVEFDAIVRPRASA